MTAPQEITPLGPLERAFGEAVLVSGLVPAPRVIYALKVRESTGGKKPLPNILFELRLIDAENSKRLWRTAEQAIKAAPGTQFTFTEGAMLGPYELVQSRCTHLAGAHWSARRGKEAALLRLVPPGTGADPERAQRLLDRANAGVDPPDPAILKIDDVGEEFNWLYTGTLGIDPSSLAARVQKGPLTEPEAIAIARGLTHALAVAHGLGVVHGGLNPLGVIFPDRSSSKVTLTDFGIGSVFFDGPTAGMGPGQRLGLLLYAAPELVAGEAESGLDARSDLYSLGALIYEGVAVVRPGDVRARDADPWVVEPPVSAGLRTVLQRLLSFDPEERYQSAFVLLEDIEKLEAGRFPGALPPPGPSHLVVPRPSAAAPQRMVTADLLLASTEAPALPDTREPSLNLDSTQSDARPPLAGLDAPLGLADSGIELAPPTDDPDRDRPERAKPLSPRSGGGGSGKSGSAPQRARKATTTAAAPRTTNRLGPSSRPAAPNPPSDEAVEAEAVPPTDDPDRERSVSSRRARVVEPEPEPERSHGFVLMALAFLVVVGAFVGLHFATANPDLMAHREVLRARLLIQRDKDYRGAIEAVRHARELVRANEDLAREESAIEREVRAARVHDYLEQRKSLASGDPQGLRDALVAGTDLECLLRFDKALGENTPPDAGTWKKLGDDLLAQGFADDAVAAFERAGSPEARDLAARARALGGFVLPGTYLGKEVRAPVYVGATCVTRAEYARWLASRTPSSPHASCLPDEPQGKSHAPAGWDPDLAVALDDHRPATGVDYYDASAYAKANQLRLVTVSELVALGSGIQGTTTPWGPGKASDVLANVGNGFGAIVPAGAFPDGAGLPVLGNVREWTQRESETAPQAPVFGAAFDAPEEKLSLATAPVPTKLDERSLGLGFRCALDISAPPPAR